MSRRPLAKPAHGSAPWDKPRRMLNRTSLFQGPLLVHKNPKHTPPPLPGVSCPLVCSRSRACQAGNPPGSTKEGLSSVSGERSLVTFTGRGLTEGVSRQLSAVSLWQKRLRGTRRQGVCAPGIGLQDSRDAFPFSAGP